MYRRERSNRCSLTVVRICPDFRRLSSLMGRLLGVQIFFGTSPAQSVVHYPQKSHSFNGNDLSFILAARSKVVGVLWNGINILDACKQLFCTWFCVCQQWAIYQIEANFWHKQAYMASLPLPKCFVCFKHCWPCPTANEMRVALTMPTDSDFSITSAFFTIWQDSLQP